MPEDMKELFKQRQRELAAERAEFAADAEKNADETALPDATTTEPKMDQVTLPPPPKTRRATPHAEPKPNRYAESRSPPPAQTRPREAEPAKKKGKKGDGEPGRGKILSLVIWFIDHFSFEVSTIMDCPMATSFKTSVVLRVSGPFKKDVRYWSLPKWKTDRCQTIMTNDFFSSHQSIFPSAYGSIFLHHGQS